MLGSPTQATACPAATASTMNAADPASRTQPYRPGAAPDEIASASGASTAACSTLTAISTAALPGSR